MQTRKDIITHISTSSVLLNNYVFNMLFKPLFADPRTAKPKFEEMFHFIKTSEIEEILEERIHFLDEHRSSMSLNKEYLNNLVNEKTIALNKHTLDDFAVFFHHYTTIQFLLTKMKHFLQALIENESTETNDELTNFFFLAKENLYNHVESLKTYCLKKEKIAEITDTSAPAISLPPQLDPFIKLSEEEKQYITSKQADLKKQQEILAKLWPAIEKPLTDLNEKIQNSMLDVMHEISMRILTTLDECNIQFIEDKQDISQLNLKPFIDKLKNILTSKVLVALEKKDITLISPIDIKELKDNQGTICSSLTDLFKTNLNSQIGNYRFNFNLNLTMFKSSSSSEVIWKKLHDSLAFHTHQLFYLFNRLMPGSTQIDLLPVIPPTVTAIAEKNTAADSLMIKKSRRSKNTRVVVPEAMPTKESPAAKIKKMASDVISEISEISEKTEDTDTLSHAEKKALPDLLSKSQSLIQSEPEEPNDFIPAKSLAPAPTNIAAPLIMPQPLRSLYIRGVNDHLIATPPRSRPATPKTNPSTPKILSESMDNKDTATLPPPPKLALPDIWKITFASFGGAIGIAAAISAGLIFASLFPASIPLIVLCAIGGGIVAGTLLTTGGFFLGKYIDRLDQNRSDEKHWQRHYWQNQNRETTKDDLTAVWQETAKLSKKLHEETIKPSSSADNLTDEENLIAIDADDSPARTPSPRF